MPHIRRLLVGWDNRLLAPVSILAGGIFPTICDTFARLIMTPAEMPVGAITVLPGDPFFIWLLYVGNGLGRQEAQE